MSLNFEKKKRCFQTGIYGQAVVWGAASSVVQSCLTLCNPVDCSLPGSSIHGILQGRTLEGAGLPLSRESSQSKDRTCISYISCIVWQFFATSATRKTQGAL